MCHRITQHNEFCSNKYLLIEKQGQEEETMWKVYNLIQCCDKLKQIKNDVFVNVEVRYNF